MRAIKLLALALLLATPGAALAEQPSWPVAFAEGRVDAAKAEAIKNRPGCMTELEHGAEGPACSSYRAGVDRVLDIYSLRAVWCLQRLENRAKPVPPVCSLSASNDPLPAAEREMGYPQFEALSRKVHPDNWAKADAARAELDR